MRIISLSDTITTCDCCGRQNLKKTVILTTSEDRFPSHDEVFAYGQQCAATALRNAGTKGFKKYLSNASINGLAKQAKNEFMSHVEYLGIQDGGLEWAKNTNRYIG